MSKDKKEPIEFGPKNEFEWDLNHSIGQIGKYPYNERPADNKAPLGIDALDTDGSAALYVGCDEYQLRNTGKAPNYHRERFLEHLAQLEQDHSTDFIKPEELPGNGGDPQKLAAKLEQRRKKPKGATTNMDDLLGEEDKILFELALEEEMYDKNYREAVFNKSTTWLPGKKWLKAPAAIIAGPSACGKSTAVKAFFKLAQKLPTEGTEEKGNQITAIDGAEGREASQMRKAAIRTSNKKGYTGIKDLKYVEKKYLGKVKSIIYSAAITNKHLGLVFPETFSKWLLDKFKRKSEKPDKLGISNVPKNKDLIDTLNKQTDREFIFVRIKGKNYEHFKKVVCFFGGKRAWATSGLNGTADLDLNSSINLKESKTHDEGGCYHGVSGSDSAYDRYSDNRQGKQEVNVATLENDFELYSKNEVETKLKSIEVWEPAKDDDPLDGIMAVSPDIFQAWNNLPEYHEEKKQGLEAYNNKYKKTEFELSDDLQKLVGKSPTATIHQSAVAASFTTLDNPGSSPSLNKPKTFTSSLLQTFRRSSSTSSSVRPANISTSEPKYKSIEEINIECFKDIKYTKDLDKAEENATKYKIELEAWVKVNGPIKVAKAETNRTSDPVTMQKHKEKFGIQSTAASDVNTTNKYRSIASQFREDQIKKEQDLAKEDNVQTSGIPTLSSSGTE
ncbi:MAG: hypothetical protein WC627_00300 [Legionella sp.]|jgi:hypothetical protein